MTEPYNLSQSQRDAATIEALQKQLQDAQTCITKLCANQTHLDIRINPLECGQVLNLRETCREYAVDAGHKAAAFILENLAHRGELYERLGQYEQWFYAQHNHSTRRDALRSTMTTARP